MQHKTITMNLKPLIAIILFLTIATQAVATEWTNYFIYQMETTTDRLDMPFDYLRPVAHYDCLSFSLENQAYSIMSGLSAYNSVFDYEKLKTESECLSVYLKAKELSDTERNELLTSLLMQGFKSVRIYLKGEEYGKTYDLRDIEMPFFLPVYFEDQSGGNTAFMDNLETMLHIVYEKALQDKWIGSIFLHEVEVGETLYGLAKRYEITQEDILKYNPNLKDSSLQIGQVLTINLYDQHTKNIPKFTSEIDKKENKSILIYLLFGLSILLNAWFIWKFYTKKK